MGERGRTAPGAEDEMEVSKEHCRKGEGQAHQVHPEAAAAVGGAQKLLQMQSERPQRESRSAPSALWYVRVAPQA